jgi:tetratricopeptide (TPR) repeat protein
VISLCAQIDHGIRWTRNNFLLTDGHFDTALELYSEAITLNPYCAVYYGNRSFCSIKLENFGDALTDANKALEIDKTYIKVKNNIILKNMSVSLKAFCN